MRAASPPVPTEVVSRLAANPHPILFLAVSGAHLYGFESPDSDWDLRGCHVAPARDVLALSPGPETFELMDKQAVPEVDIVTHDVRKFFLMLLKNNGYVLEQVFSPLVVRAAAEFDELRAIARRCICKHHRHHFFHFGIDQWRLVQSASEPTVKGLLYTYRPLLAGIHLMRTGEVESNLRVLNAEARIGEIGDLIARKLAGAERMTVSQAELERHRPIFDRLCAELDEARERSGLPEETAAEARAALNDLLLRLRARGPTERRTPRVAKGQAAHDTAHAYPEPAGATIDEIRPGACAVMVDGSGRVLLQRRADNGHWGLPGGSMDRGESAAACVVRECKEETEYDVEVKRLLGVYSDPARRQIVRYPDGNTVHFVTLAFVCAVTGGEGRVNDESTEQGWFDPRALPEPLVPAHRDRIADLLRGDGPPVVR